MKVEARVVTPEKLAALLVDALTNNDDRYTSSYVDDEDITDVVIDGHFDLIKVAKYMIDRAV